VVGGEHGCNHYVAAIAGQMELCLRRWLPTAACLMASHLHCRWLVGRWIKRLSSAWRGRRTLCWLVQYAHSREDRLPSWR